MAVVSPITSADLTEVGTFLHEHLNARVAAASWASAVDVPWQIDQPNYGFKLTDEDAVLVGVLLAFYSERVIDGKTVRFCNLGAWCVLPAHRLGSLRMLRTALRQPGFTFTDMSPSGAVVPLNERLGFDRLPAGVQLVPCLPMPAVRTKVVDDPEEIERLLTGHDLQIYQDHRRAQAAHHVVLCRDGHQCYVIYRRDRRRNIPAFVSVLYVSDAPRFRKSLTAFGSYVLRRRQGLALLLEERIVGSIFIAPRLQGRPKMFKSMTIRAEHVDNLYSELTCVAW